MSQKQISRWCINIERHGIMRKHVPVFLVATPDVGNRAHNILARLYHPKSRRAICRASETKSEKS